MNKKILDRGNRKAKVLRLQHRVENKGRKVMISRLC